MKGEFGAITDFPFNQVGTYTLHISPENEACKVVCEVSNVVDLFSILYRFLIVKAVKFYKFAQTYLLKTVQLLILRYYFCALMMINLFLKTLVTKNCV